MVGFSHALSCGRFLANCFLFLLLRSFSYCVGFTDVPLWSLWFIEEAAVCRLYRSFSACSPAQVSFPGLTQHLVLEAQDRCAKCKSRGNCLWKAYGACSQKEFRAACSFINSESPNCIIHRVTQTYSCCKFNIYGAEARTWIAPTDFLWGGETQGIHNIFKIFFKRRTADLQSKGHLNL